MVMFYFADPISTKKKYKKSELGLSKDIFCISLYAMLLPALDFSPL